MDPSPDDERERSVRSWSSTVPASARTPIACRRVPAAPPGRAREELRAAAYLADRGSRECLVRGSFCATGRGVGGGAFESRCCVRGLCSGRRLRRAGAPSTRPSALRRRSRRGERPPRRYFGELGSSSSDVTTLCTTAIAEERAAGTQDCERSKHADRRRLIRRRHGQAHRR